MSSRLPAVLLGLLAALAAIPAVWGLLFLGAYVLPAVQNRHHQPFATNGAASIAPAAEMDRMFDDCRRYVTYGAEGVPLLNSVAYFGGRYELTMQVPVEVESADVGTAIGPPQFFLNELASIRVSPSGAVGAQTARDLRFGLVEWNRVVAADGDFGVIGIELDPTPVPNFDRYRAATRPSN